MEKLKFVEPEAGQTWQDQTLIPQCQTVNTDLYWHNEPSEHLNSFYFVAHYPCRSTASDLLTLLLGLLCWLREQLSIGVLQRKVPCKSVYYFKLCHVGMKWKESRTWFSKCFTNKDWKCVVCVPFSQLSESTYELFNISINPAVLRRPQKFVWEKLWIKSRDQALHQTSQ